MVPSTSKMTCVTASLSITASTWPPSADTEEQQRAEKFCCLLSVCLPCDNTGLLCLCLARARSEETRKLWRPRPAKIERADGRTDWLTEGSEVVESYRRRSRDHQARTGLVVLSQQNFSRTIRAHFQFSTILSQRVGDLSNRESFIWNKNSPHSTLCFLTRYLGSLSLYNYCWVGEEVKERTSIQFPLRNFFKGRLSIKLITKVVVPVLVENQRYCMLYLLHNINTPFLVIRYIIRSASTESISF